ncbi:outward-rectifier potassium channel, putative [Candida dubliniensis CD36]|uniref:Outward-rectifier potassium channel, putative n=1 Tax=Candida dubliniensis (strain CD36 / ATCC MYA-646 / CBS 7987 / NCPF 3949 / NRRL Y-17841) TaxID=573826 RepID=B9WFE0_CANDC|nr:outward-rectifier potassium channel, putative [Candida dubliniensis CD36]CAX41959.1 outward-rectifier potassium channel, putative [Candida dubliniensis CD36]
MGFRAPMNGLAKNSKSSAFASFDSVSVMHIVNKAKDKIVPDPQFHKSITDQGIRHYQEKLSPLFQNSYHGVSSNTNEQDSPYMKSPVTLQHALNVRLESILNLNVRPGEPYFVLWFLISSYFPLIAACLGPLANMISIVALVEHWKLDIITNKKVPDIPKVVVMNAISLALGLIGNVSLLMNFSRSVKYLVSQSVSIIAWLCASALLAAALLVTNREFGGENPKYVPSEGFYFAAFTSGNYFVCMLILVINFMGFSLKKYPPTFNLDQKQRTLMLFTILFSSWTIIGAFTMGSLIDDISYGSALYYCIVSFLTIGLGDILPKTSGAKVAVLVFSLGGVLIMGLIVATLRSVILSSAAPAIFWNDVEKARTALLAQLERENRELTSEESFHEMRVLRRKVKSRHKKVSLVLTITVFMIFWLIGALIFQRIEKWSYFNAMYFCFLCLITIGYGDYAPKTSLGRVFFVSWAVGAVPLMTILVSNVGDALYDIFNDISAWFSTWMFSTKEEYTDLKRRKKRLQEDQEDQLTVNSEAVRSSELDEDLDLAKMEREASLEASDGDSNGNIRTVSNNEEDISNEDNDTCITNASGSNMQQDKENNSCSERSVSKSGKQDFNIERIRQKIASKKQVHEMLIDYLEKMKPLIGDSIESPNRKYSYKQWKGAYDGFWLSESSPLRLPLKEPNYLILKIYFEIEMMLRGLVDKEIEDLKAMTIQDVPNGSSPSASTDRNIARTIKFDDDK